MGILDALAFKKGESIIGVQACGYGDFRAHVRKLTGSHARHTRHWLESGNRLLLIGWKPTPSEPRIKWLTLDDLD
jgi:hypothetical protein